MPRLVDHEQRRQEIADAAVRLILDQGLAGVTIRGIVAATGRSTGSLWHYFADQNALRTFVAAAVTDQLHERVYPRLAPAGARSSVLDRVASAIEELLPVDVDRREEYALWSAVVEWERLRPPVRGSRTWQEQRGPARVRQRQRIGRSRVPAA